MVSRVGLLFHGVTPNSSVKSLITLSVCLDGNALQPFDSNSLLMGNKCVDVTSGEILNTESMRLSEGGSEGSNNILEGMFLLLIC